MKLKQLADQISAMRGRPCKLQQIRHFLCFVAAYASCGTPVCALLQTELPQHAFHVHSHEKGVCCKIELDVVSVLKRTCGFLMFATWDVDSFG